MTVFFMIIYYKMGGFVADIALFFNLLFIVAILAGFQATLTLPGIAGMILTIGMAVDANVLINERIREELEGGKTIRAAIDLGYSKAFSAILDSNVTTFLTGIILYQFGSGPIQGFALTLMIGIVATMFSAIVITRVVFNLMTDRGITPNFG
jgi:preprotein translocase subunit SecD